MKKSFFLFIFCGGIVFVLSGCVMQAEQKNKTTQVQGSEEHQKLFRRPDFGQPKERADFSGIVKSIIGNEATILKVERPQRDENEKAVSENREKKKTDAAPAMLGGTTEVRPMGRMGGMKRPRGENGEFSREDMMERMKEMSTGEEKIVIPVGIRMLKTERVVEGEMPEPVEATLTDITSDKMIRVWLNKEITDRKVANFIIIF